MISDLLLFQKQHSIVHSPVLVCTNVRLGFPDLTELINLKDCVQETNFTVTQINACNRCCLCFSHLKRLVCDGRCCAENSVNGITVPFCNNSSRLC